MFVSFSFADAPHARKDIAFALCSRLVAVGGEKHKGLVEFIRSLMSDGRVTTGVFFLYFFPSPLLCLYFPSFTSCGYDGVWQAGLHEEETAGDAAPLVPMMMMMMLLLLLLFAC